MKGTDHKEVPRPIDEQTVNVNESVSGVAAPALSPAERQRDRSLCKALMNSMYDALLILDEKGNVIACNPRAEKFWGYPESTLWGMSAFQLVAGLNAIVLSKIRAHVADGRFTVLNTKGIKQGGNTFAAEIAFGAIHYLHDQDLLLTIRNVDRKQKVERKQALERDAAAYCPVPILLITETFAIEYANAATAARLTGKPDESLAGQAFTSFVADPAALQKACAAVVDQEHWQGTLMLKDPQGKGESVSACMRRLPAQSSGQTLIAVSLGP